MDMELDPEIAAQMGFSSFGGVSKKRKFDADDAFTNVQNNAPGAQEPHHTGANAIPVGPVGTQNRFPESTATGKLTSTLTDGTPWILSDHISRFSTR